MISLRLKGGAKRIRSGGEHPYGGLRDACSGIASYISVRFAPEANVRDCSAVDGLDVMRCRGSRSDRPGRRE